ncbi:MAG: ParB/RepB/Spo0J family partition protein [Congregibacter sp.]|nr:ParB/RepB/Spo0J family partition protein [Congregibacter sp.]
MAAKRRSLGKGLDALLAGSNRSDAIPSDVTDGREKGLLQELPVDLIQRGKFQPRRDFDPFALQELADSIKAQGVMQPIVVRPIANDRYEIIAGERRWRAVQQAGLDSIPVLIRDVSDEATIAMSLIENIQREDLNPMEEAYALERLQNEFDMTQQQVADAVGKSRSAVANLLRLTSLQTDVRTLLEHGDLDMGHARCLLTLDAGHQLVLARRIVAKGLSVRQAEALVKEFQTDKPTVQPKTLDPNIRSLQDELSQKLGSAVLIQHTASGKGRLVLSYGSLDELDGILSHLK